MNLNSKSFSARLYRWFYAHNKMPNNLCPYFWKLFVAYILALPVFIVTLPYEICWGKFGKDHETLGAKLGLSLVCYLIVVAAMTLLSPLCLLIYSNIAEDSILHKIIGGGIFLWFLAIGVSLGLLIEYLVKRLRDRNETSNKTKNKNIVVEFVKAKYNKYCPKIDWNE